MTHPMIEEAARAIDPNSYVEWQRLYDFCIKAGDAPEEAEACAHASYGLKLHKARAVALIACRIAIKACAEKAKKEAIFQIEEASSAGYTAGGLTSFEIEQSAEEVADVVRALSEQIGEP